MKMTKEDEKEFFDDCKMQELKFEVNEGSYSSMMHFIEEQYSEANPHEISVSEDGRIGTVFIPWGWAVEKDMTVYLIFNNGTVLTAFGK